MSGAFAYATATETPTGSTTVNPLTMGATLYDSGGYWSATHPTRLTVTTSGLYRVGARFSQDTGYPSDNAYFMLRLNQSGQTNDWSQIFLVMKWALAYEGGENLPIEHDSSMSTVYRFNAGDWFELCQTNVNRATSLTPTPCAIWISQLP